MTRLWPSGSPIRVETGPLGLPQAFTWETQTHPVEGIANRWRVDEDWWRQRIWRDYFKVITRTGLMVILFQDLLTGQWYVQRLYD
jgi:hypothetical protein